MLVTFASAYLSWTGRGNVPRNFREMAAVTLCCAALGNRVWIDVPWGRIYPSLWVALVGSSAVRKSSAVNVACDLFAQAMPPEYDLPQDFSREAVVEHLSVKPYGLLRWSEMGSALESFSRDYNAGVLSTLTDIWDSRASMTRLTKGAGLVTITYPAMTILAAGKLRWLQEHITPKQIGGGFIGRWLFCLEERNEGYRPLFSLNGYDRDVARIQRNSLIDHLQQLGQLEGEVAPGEGGDALDAWLKDNEERWSDDDDPAEFSRRAAANIMKLALGIQACRGADQLDSLKPVAIKQAIEHWLYTFECGRKIVDGILNRGRDSDAMNTVLRLIKQEQVIRRRDLCRKTRMKVRDLDEYLESFIAGGLVVLQKTANEGGGPDIVWYRFVG